LTGLLCAIALGTPSLARASDISDAGSFFSAETVRKANESLRALEKKTGHEVHIETYATVPDDKAATVPKLDAAGRDKFFSNWLHDRAEATKARGVFILICKEPGHLQFWVGNPLQRAGFTAAQAKAVREKLVAGFKREEYDKALNEAVSQLVTDIEGLRPAHSSSSSAAPVNHNVHQNPRPIHQAPPPRPMAGNSGFGGLPLVMAIIIGGVFAFSMIARMFGGGAQRGYGPGPATGYGPAPGNGPPGYGPG